ncbi:hypothetical protein LB566_26655 [Mesorhizobium sp. CA13]|uniref:hypothetical protein n=1 Tax=unclassified Mesorhizobium TaxID=325217 RepID=UPI0015E46B76|nr:MULTISPECIES: hypothetical protein [unclassified Mesorhizobium]MBZ9857374.1 hypothetical protein [Mesorhizobium sp. CA13]MBZ9967789.1 hypothetical protein [Mesorhizobium sp. BR1-1-2]MCA0016382.1 hypothetical protein [Mesorhizobium sp. B294B1A1]MCA0038429.1 hypothetical protein [Mesorhizobium sp. B292B1B]
MSDTNPNPSKQAQVAKGLAVETGISAEQALELVQLLGLNSSSLLFHARALKKVGKGGS